MSKKVFSVMRKKAPPKGAWPFKKPLVEALAVEPDAEGGEQDAAEAQEHVHVVGELERAQQKVREGAPRVGHDADGEEEKYEPVDLAVRHGEPQL